MTHASARTDGLNISSVGDEMVIHDTIQDLWHTLEPSVGAVFRAADGTRDDAAIAAHTGLDLAGVAAALSALADVDLVTLPSGLSRRSLMTRGAVVGGVALASPLILSLRAPYASAAVSAPGNTDASASPTVLKIDLGGSGDSHGYVSDTAYTAGGTLYPTTHAIDDTGVSNPPSQAVLKTGRYQNFDVLASGLLPNSPYTVTIYSAETYFGVDGHGGGTGSRVWTASVAGGTSQSNIDVYAMAGGPDKLVAITLTGNSDALGKMTVHFTSQVDNAFAHAIKFS
jgi:hypothetical protein